jgi:hypothetical protein
VALIRKMRCENTLGMFIEWCEREVSLWTRNVLWIVSEIILGLYTEFVDVNRKSTDICIPAIKLVAAKKY